MGTQIGLRGPAQPGPEDQAGDWPGETGQGYRPGEGGLSGSGSLRSLSSPGYGLESLSSWASAPLSRPGLSFDLAEAGLSPAAWDAAVDFAYSLFDQTPMAKDRNLALRHLPLWIFSSLPALSFLLLRGPGSSNCLPGILQDVTDSCPLCMVKF